MYNYIIKRIKTKEIKSKNAEEFVRNNKNRCYFPLEQGIITIDHLIKRGPTGRGAEKGPLFKLKNNSLNLLIPPSIKSNQLS